MRLQQKGSKLSGSYGAEGFSTVEGEVKGRHARLRWKRLDYPGKAWIEQTPDGKRFFGQVEEKPARNWLGLRLEDFENGVEPEPGETVQGLTDAGLLYFLRVPKAWKRGRAVDVIVLLHGSNWTTRGMVAVTAANWPGLADDFAILGLQGQNWVDTSELDDLRFNYTYVNWMGRSTYKGYPNTDRESPSLVAEALIELKQRYDFDRVLLGGHSQGAFLTTILAMHHPELLDGAFPMAGGMVIQAEPDVFEDEDLLAAQRATPIAIVHGKNDTVVPPSTGDYVHERFLTSGFPMLRHFTPDAGHGYDFLPVEEVVRWLDALSSPDPERLTDFAKEADREENWSEVAAALARAEPTKASARLSAVRKAYDKAAARRAEHWLETIKKNADASWIDEFLEWRDQFQFAPAAAETMETFAELQAKHDKKAEKLLADARLAFQTGRREKGREKQREVVERWYACTRYRIVKGWLGE